MNLVISLLLALLIGQMSASDSRGLTGAWQTSDAGVTHTVIFTDSHYSVAEYDLMNKKFIATYGGSWSINGDRIKLLEEYNTLSTDLIGIPKLVEYRLNNVLVLPLKRNTILTWKKIDGGAPGKLAGAWLITGRQNNGELSKITPGARRTMKILSGARFQWIAYNTETKEFFGTGGGTYTTENGKYTESIEFFSRDNSRVGGQLEFDFALEKGNWRHKGLSSKGDPIDEIWTKREVVGL